MCWSAHRRCGPSFQYRHHNLYARASLFSKHCPPYVAFTRWFETHFCAWISKATGLEGRVSMSASRYAPLDYSAPHTDAGHGRAIAFVYHLATDWDDAWGGDLVWCSPFGSFEPTFNTLYLFEVTDLSHHFVQPVTEYAASKRLALNGWFVVDGDRTAAYIAGAEAHAARLRAGGSLLHEA